MEHMQTMRMWKITQELKLDQAGAAKVFPLLAKFDEQERDLARTRHEIFRNLRAELQAAAPDNKKLNGLIDQAMAHRARLAALAQEKFAALRKVLTPVQQARIMMLLPNIEEGFRQRIRETMGGGRRRMYGPGYAPDLPPQ
jgi:Spy/CpxP family protein refolding chaperone